MSEPATSATVDGRPLPATCGCGGHCTREDRCEECGACAHLPHGTHHLEPDGGPAQPLPPLPHPEPSGAHHRPEADDSEESGDE